MSDNRNLRGPQDASRINVNEDYELKYWTDKFNITQAELKEAVKTVGVSVSAVEAYLKEQRRVA